MADTRPTTFVPPPDRCDPLIRYLSHQPTVQIRRARAGLREYLVYVGHRSHSHCEASVIWAYLFPHKNSLSMRLREGVSNAQLSIDGFLGERSESPVYELAVWLHRLMENSHVTMPNKSQPKRAWEPVQALIKDAVHAALDECAGHEIHYGLARTRALHDANIVAPYEISGMLPRYWVSQFPKPCASRTAFSFDPELGDGDLVWKENATSEPHSHLSNSSKHTNTDREVTKAERTSRERGIAGKVMEQVVNSNEVDNRPGSALSDTNSSAELDQQAIARQNTDSTQDSNGADDISLQNRHRRETKSQSSSRGELSNCSTDFATNGDANADSSVKDKRGNGHTAQDYRKPRFNDDQGGPSPWNKEFDRVLLTPLRGVAVNEIEEHLRKWREGLIDEDTLESRIGTSLSNVREALEWKNKLARNDPKTVVNNNGNSNTAKKGKERESSHSDGESAAAENPAKRLRTV
ncbi:hypothetical protein PV08_04598 [Exophiala spinifera]|uniref:Uncharacterized protein n=1 Tax=Exophiala spinifera TaxID=91928 RepID=A0A0D2C140_9EURO|nr:uncharacterized protein PV08_04598 [Exophiala spinifera]KIW17404.1 hypothetical protein PV08_04598 [Exophiala spinifera]